MNFGRKEVEHLAKLSRLALGEAEMTRLEKEIPEVLEYVGQLQQVPTDHIQPMTHGGGPSQTIREDKVAQDLQEKEQVTKAFPDKMGSLLKVKSILKRK